MLITYRRENGAAETTWEAAFSGYRVLPNGVVDMDADSITLRSETDETVLHFREERFATRRDRQAQQRAAPPSHGLPAPPLSCSSSNTAAPLDEDHEPSRDVTEKGSMPEAARRVPRRWTSPSPNRDGEARARVLVSAYSWVSMMRTRSPSAERGEQVEPRRSWG